MIRFLRGNIFDSSADALVNTVNCVGVMGKGIAYQFKRAYPEMFDNYVRQCRAGEILLGHVTTYREKNRCIINFPTKHHWRSKSKLSDIEAGLHSLRQVIEEHQIKHIALPPLGCGNGGLQWNEVRDKIISILESVENTTIDVYEPIGSFSAEVAKKPKVTLSHFILAALRIHLISKNKLVLQKAAYFFNVFSGDPYFRFDKYKYGPYSVSIDHLSQTIRDYLDYTKLSLDQMIEEGLKQSLEESSSEKLRRSLPVIRTVARLCNQYASHLEEMATVHAIIKEHQPIGQDDITARFFKWSEEKSKFSKKDVERAIELLEDLSLVQRALFGIELSPPLHSQRTIINVDLSLDLDTYAALHRLSKEWNSDQSTIIENAVRDFVFRNQND